jgi:hypothetical protein
MHQQAWLHGINPRAPIRLMNRNSRTHVELKNPRRAAFAVPAIGLSLERYRRGT